MKAICRLLLFSPAAVSKCCMVLAVRICGRAWPDCRTFLSFSSVFSNVPTMGKRNSQVLLVQDKSSNPVFAVGSVVSLNQIPYRFDLFAFIFFAQVLYDGLNGFQLWRSHYFWHSILTVVVDFVVKCLLGDKGCYPFYQFFSRYWLAYKQIFVQRSVFDFS